MWDPSLLNHSFELVIHVHVLLYKIVFYAIKRMAFLESDTLVSGIFFEAANTPIV